MLNRSIPILVYHQVTPHPVPALRKYAMSPRAFAAQMAWLALAGYAPITLDALWDGRAGRAGLPPRPVVITFDDGYCDCLEHAVPMLRARGFSAAFFLVAGLMGKTSEWLSARFGVRAELMDWPDARQVEAAGLQCGSHTLSHACLTALDAEACRREMCESRLLLEDRLGRPIRHMAYPFGAFDEPVRALAAESGYRTACTTQPGLSPSNDDWLALHRITVDGRESLLDFACRLRTGYSFKELLRRAARRVPRSRRPTQTQAI